MHLSSRACERASALPAGPLVVCVSINLQKTDQTHAALEKLSPSTGGIKNIAYVFVCPFGTALKLSPEKVS